MLKCLRSIFILFGTPLYIHSDRAMLFMSEQVRQFLHGHSNGYESDCTIKLASANRKCPITGRENLSEFLHTTQILQQLPNRISEHTKDFSYSNKELLEDPQYLYDFQNRVLSTWDATFNTDLAPVRVNSSEKSHTEFLLKQVDQ